MLTANLLPLEEKKSVQREEYRRIIFFFGGAGAVVLAVGLVLLVPAYIFLSVTRNNLSDQVSAETTLAQKLNLRQSFADAMRMDALLKEVRSGLDRGHRSSQLVKTFFVRSAGIRVDTLAIAEDRNVAISGFAQTRDDLLDFQKQLQDSQLLEAVSFPISDIIHSSDIHFTMRGMLKAGQEL